MFFKKKKKHPNDKTIARYSDPDALRASALGAVVLLLLLFFLVHKLFSPLTPAPVRVVRPTFLSTAASLQR